MGRKKQMKCMASAAETRKERAGAPRQLGSLLHCAGSWRLTRCARREAWGVARVARVALIAVGEWRSSWPRSRPCRDTDTAPPTVGAVRWYYLGSRRGRASRGGFFASSDASMAPIRRACRLLPSSFLCNLGMKSPAHIDGEFRVLVVARSAWHRGGKTPPGGIRGRHKTRLRRTFLKAPASTQKTRARPFFGARSRGP